MGTVVEDAQVAASWIAKALESSGYRADFSPGSLWELDRFFEENSRDGKPLPGGLLAESLGSRLFALGAYVGEVVIRAKGGAWRGNDADPQAEINIEVVLPGDGICWPVQRVMKRLRNGPEDGIAAYGLGLDIPVGPKPPSPARKRWWRFK
jgi:hypothetical protein